MSKKINNKLAVVNSTFGQGVESKEVGSFDKYIGIAPFYVLGVNPGIEQLKEWFPNRDYDQNPPKYEYNKEGEAKGVFVTFFVKVNGEHDEVSHLSKDGEPLNFITRCSYLLKNEMMMNRDKTKVQVINAYGDTGWLTSEQWKSKELPEYMIKNGYLTEGMRPAYVGEESLINFIKTFVNIPNPRKYDNDTKTWSNKTGEDLKAALAQFSTADINKILDGDMTPVKNSIKYQPKNQIKLLLGVRTTADNKEFQDVCTRIPIRFATRDYKRVAKELQNIIDNGGYGSTEFGEMPFKFQKYEVSPTTFQQGNDEDPFGKAPEVDPFAGFTS